MTPSELEKYMLMYYRSVYRTALINLKNPSDADDVAQEVFLGLYTYSGSFNSDEHVRAWLLRCAINRSRNILRSYWHRNSLPLTEAEEKVHYDDKDSSAAPDIPLMKLPEKYRTALYLHYYEGYSAEQIAKITGSSRSAVLSRLMRGRKQLAKFITDERNEDHEL